jgi:hypothetical protein
MLMERGSEAADGWGGVCTLLYSRSQHLTCLSRPQENM